MFTIKKYIPFFQKRNNNDLKNSIENMTNVDIRNMIKNTDSVSQKDCKKEFTSDNFGIGQKYTIKLSMVVDNYNFNASFITNSLNDKREFMAVITQNNKNIRTFKNGFSKTVFFDILEKLPKEAVTDNVR